MELFLIENGLPPELFGDVYDALEDTDKLAMSQADNWIRERRLRPIYELLDSGNNKKVVPEVDRVLKKQPGLTCAKVLKALALIRMSKAADARTILDPIVEEMPTDDGTIQALSICYRELDEPVKICSILEAACKKEQSEELLTHCFMAQARISEYHKQYLTAMNLYKLYGKPSYFGWGVASMYVKAERLIDEPKVKMVSLQVAERMLNKFTADLQEPEENILYLYFGILFLQENWKELLLVMELHGYPMPNFRNDDVHEMYCHALNALDRREELFGFLKDMFLQTKSELHILKQMINLFAKTNPDWVVAFFDRIRARYPSRVIAVADLLYFTVYVPADEAFPRIAQDLNMICDYALEKPSMLDDVEAFLDCLVTEEAKQDFLQRVKLPNDNNEDCIPKYESVGKVIRDVNFELVDRIIYPDLDPVARMKRAHRCVRKYLQAEIDMTSLRNDDNLKTKESDYHDQFFVIAASSLLSKYDEDEHDFDGVIEKLSLSNETWSESNDVDVLAGELIELINIDKNTGTKRDRQRKVRGKALKDVQHKPIPGAQQQSDSEPEDDYDDSDSDLENEMEKLDLVDKNGSSGNERKDGYDETIEPKKINVADLDPAMEAYYDLCEGRRQRFVETTKREEEEAATYNMFEDESRMDTDVNSWMQSLGWFELRGQLKTESPYVLRDDEYLMIAALNLAEYGLQHCPYNHSLRILLARAYIRVGAVRRALTIFQGLDLKHVQWDSLGYLFLPRMISGGLFADSLKTLIVAESMYTGYKRECMEHIIAAYKYGNFCKIKEFASFRDMLCNSIHYGIVTMEKKMLEYLMANTAPELRRIAEIAERELEQDITFTQLSSYADNRDFSVIPLVGGSNHLEGAKTNSYYADLTMFRMKQSMVLLLTKAILVTTDPNGPDLTPENTVKIGKYHENFKLAVFNVKSFSGDIHEAKYLYGIWPHKTERYRELACFSALVAQFECALELMEPAMDTKQPILPMLARKIGEDVNVQLRRLNVTMESLTLLTIGQAMEDTQCMLEALNVSRILFWVALLLVKNKVEKNKTGKKKKSRNDSEMKKEYAIAIEIVESTIKSVLMYLGEFEKALQTLGPFKWKEAEKQWGPTIGVSFRVHIFPKCFDNVQQYICDSHYIQLAEMRRTAEGMVEFLQSLI